MRQPTEILMVLFCAVTMSAIVLCASCAGRRCACDHEHCLAFTDRSPSTPINGFLVLSTSGNLILYNGAPEGMSW